MLQIATCLLTWQQLVHEMDLFAAPVHQFKQYYRVGNVDDCLAYWNDLWDCLKQRTKYRDPVSLQHTSWLSLLIE